MFALQTAPAAEIRHGRELSAFCGSPPTGSLNFAERLRTLPSCLASTSLSATLEDRRAFIRAAQHEHLLCIPHRARIPAPIQSPRHLCPPPTARRDPSGRAVTAVFEVALGSCRCTCAGSRGLCGTGQTAPCSLGNSATSQQCCKAGPKGKQVRNTCWPKAATHPKAATSSGFHYRPWLDQLCQS